MMEAGETRLLVDISHLRESHADLAQKATAQISPIPFNYAPPRLLIVRI